MDIIYQDKRILVAVKPHGILSTDEPGGLPSLLRTELGDEKACVRTVHRLDASVGGLMVLARSAKASSLLSQQVRERDFGKEYLAIVHGEPPAKATLEDLLGRDTRRRITFVAAEPGKDVRPAKLDYEVLAHKDGLSLLRIHLHTGRTHQIRVQFASRNFPLVGDRKYGIPEETDTPIALWSWRLQFTHPESGEDLDFTHLPPASAPWSAFTEELNALKK